MLRYQWTLASVALVVIGCGKSASEVTPDASSASTGAPPTASADDAAQAVADVAEANPDAGRTAAAPDAGQADIAAAPPRYFRGRIELPGEIVVGANVVITGDTGTIDIPLQQLTKAPIHDARADEREVSFGFTPPGAPAEVVVRFTAKKNDGDDGYSGEVDQLGTKLPLRLVPVASAEDFVAKRPQTPRPPFAYKTEQLALKVDGAELGCTLSLPEAEGARHPAVVMFTGSGPQDRDETIFEHKPFLVIAHALANAKVASLRCDDRGVGQSTGDPAAGHIGVFAADGLAMIRALGERPEIDAKKIGVLGHSEGGIVAAELLAQGEAAFGVLLAGPARSGREVSLKQNMDALIAQGVSPDKATVVEQAVDALFGAVADDAEPSVVEAKVAALAEAVVAARAPSEGGPPAAALTAEFMQLAKSPWLRSWVKSKPAETLARSKAPILALYGEKDTQVPGADHAAVLKQAFEKAKKEGGEVEVILGANHLFQAAKTGKFSEYEEIEETIQPSVLSRIVGWIEKQVAQ